MRSIFGERQVYHNGHAIDEFIGWYCSEPRLAFNRSVVLRYRFFLEQSKPRDVSSILVGASDTALRLLGSFE